MDRESHRPTFRERSVLIRQNLAGSQTLRVRCVQSVACSLFSTRSNVQGLWDPLDPISSNGSNWILRKADPSVDPIGAHTPRRGVPQMDPEQRGFGVDPKNDLFTFGDWIHSHPGKKHAKTCTLTTVEKFA